LHCAEIEPATSCVVGNYSGHGRQIVGRSVCMDEIDTLLMYSSGCLQRVQPGARAGGGPGAHQWHDLPVMRAEHRGLREGAAWCTPR
jgi:hypothetical protein